MCEVWSAWGVRTFVAFIGREDTEGLDNKKPNLLKAEVNVCRKSVKVILVEI